MNDDEYFWLGLDDRGVELEIIAVQKPDCLLVIHVFPTALRTLRRKKLTRRARKGDLIRVTMPDGTVKTYVDGGNIDLDKDVVLDWNGERYTEAKARADAERISQKFRAQLGRPSLEGSVASGRKSPQVSFRVPQKLARRAEAVAARDGKSISQLGREALEKYLDEQEAAKSRRRRSA